MVNAASGDREILKHISGMVDEEKRLRAGIKPGPDGDEARGRLRAIEVELDQCWDLLRQRRARAEAGEDPSEAKVRPAEEVERYLN